MINLTQSLMQMTRQAASVRQLAQDISPEQARWKPNPESWSILEVINHLADEEQSDFRVRLDIILHDPERQWPLIDPQGWVTARKYNERDLAESVGRFMTAREESIAWLRSLNAPNFDAVVEDPRGRMRAGDMFAAWIAHDLLHIRQLVELHWAYTEREFQPYHTLYAGEW
jgi:hypothetical protein